MSGKRLAVWICNAVVAVLSILSIVCYFFGPFWEFNASITLDAKMMDDVLKNVNFSEDGISLTGTDIVGEEGQVIKISFQIGTDDILTSISGNSDELVDKLVGKNVDNIVNQIKPALMDVAKKTVKSVAKTTVKDEIHSNVKKYFSDESMSDEDVAKKMEDLGITDDYIGQKTDQIIDKVFEENANVDDVTEEIMDTVKEVYGDIQTKAQEQGGEYSDLADLELTPEDEEEIRKNVKETLEKVASDESGNIDPEDLIEQLLSQMMNGDKGDNTEENTSAMKVVTVSENVDDQNGSSSDQNAPVEGVPSDPTNDPTNDPEQAEDLAAQIKTKIMDMIPDSVGTYLNYVFLGLAGLMFFSMFSWVYILIKLLVKLLKRDPNPTVKLKFPIWLGWLPYLLLGGIPITALMLLPMILSRIPEVPEQLDILNSIKVQCSSIAIISMISAVICFGISIFYMVMRRRFKKEAGIGKKRRRAQDED